MWVFRALCRLRAEGFLVSPAGQPFGSAAEVARDEVEEQWRGRTRLPLSLS
jgi:hypothetical protein